MNVGRVVGIVGVGQHERLVRFAAPQGDCEQQVVVVDAAVAIVIESCKILHELDSTLAKHAEAELAVDPFEDTAESDAAWKSGDQADPISLRDYMGEHPKSSGAETARARLRVIDAQAWVEAVTSDNEKAYQSYLAKFPAQGAGAGAMTKAAEERLTSLGEERKQAIEEIQRGLTALSFYSGAIDGKSGASTNKAATAFATNAKKKAPALATAAPRELRQFADLIQAAAVKAGKPAELTSYQFDLLVVLAERAGRVLTRDQIMEAVRGRELEAFDRSIDVHMGRIRAAIEADPKNPKRILTVRGVGYVFAKQQD